MYPLGYNQFADDIEMMLGKRPCFYWRFCWTFFTPFVLFVSIIVSLYSLSVFISLWVKNKLRQLIRTPSYKWALKKPGINVRSKTKRKYRSDDQLIDCRLHYWRYLHTRISQAITRSWEMNTRTSRCVNWIRHIFDLVLINLCSYSEIPRDWYM